MAKISECGYVGCELEKKRRRRDDVSVDSEKGWCDENSNKNRKEVKLGEPVIRCVWSGDLDVHYEESIYHRRIYSFNAFVSTKSCPKAAIGFEEVLYFEMVPTSCVLTRRSGSGPTGEDIGLYFFPPLPLHEPLYDALVYEMMKEDLSMKASAKDSQLVIFTSAELPPPCRRFQGKFYLWGFFSEFE